MINQFIAEICDFLKIDSPKIVYSTKKFPTKTTMAIVEINSKTLYLRRCKSDFDFYFAIAHELRHLWQSENDPDYYFSDYLKSDAISIDEYNAQIAEVDANAFAAIAMTDFFGVKPLWNDFSQENIRLIENRIDEIKEMK